MDEIVPEGLWQVWFQIGKSRVIVQVRCDKKLEVESFKESLALDAVFATQ